ncbi:MAG TPA: hypothetical protein VK989_12765 [Polyangia bacterium]|nr:hypothetical protein [Polyangia bacterium]
MIVGTLLLRSRRVTPLALAIVLFASTGCGQRGAEPTTATAAGPAASALRAYRDPVTGAFGPPPAGAPVTPPRASLNGTTATRAPLQEIAAPGGGRMVRLQGGFRSHVTAKRSPVGTAVSCAVVSR